MEVFGRPQGSSEESFVSNGSTAAQGRQKPDIRRHQITWYAV